MTQGSPGTFEESKSSPAPILSHDIHEHVLIPIDNDPLCMHTACVPIKCFADLTVDYTI